MTTRISQSIAMITGATSGIGKACAGRFAREGYDLIITGRRKDRLEEIREQLEYSFPIKVKPLSFDVRDRLSLESLMASLEEDWKRISVLVNNAGLALRLDPVQEGDPADWDTMIDTNVKGLLYLSREVSRLMIRHGRGHIIHIGSIAGREVYPSGNVYCATKHAVDALTRAMRIDLLPYGIRVTQIAPGAVETEFSEVRFGGDKDRARKVYEGYKPLSGADVAEAVYWVTTLPEHANVNDLLIMPMAQASATIFHKNKRP
ncbi:MAG: SDR family oxidoreductase [Bacteroidales bacterium]|nr:SDR family oxidoreductase [Bacteroidales bacterium]